MNGTAENKKRTQECTPRICSVRSTCAVFIISLLTLLLASTSHPTLELYDDGIIVSGADAILHGKLPYRDFWTMYAPGQFYLTALLFHIFAPQLYIARLVGVLSKVAIITLGYISVKHCTQAHGKLLPAACAVVLTLTLAYMGNETFPAFPATALAMLALMLMERGLVEYRLKMLFIAGLSTALAACMRHDMGFYTALALSFGTMFISRVQPQPRSWPEISRALGAYWGGILSIGIPVAAFFLYHVPLHDLYENLIYIPSVIYPRVRRLPWPGVTEAQEIAAYMANVSEFPLRTLIWGMREFVVYVPFLVATPSLLISAQKLYRSRQDGAGADATCSFILLASALSLLMTLKGTVRPSPHHLAPAVALAVPAGLLMIRQALPTINIMGRLLTICLALASLPLTATCVAGYLFVSDGLFSPSDKDTFSERCLHPALLRLRCVMGYASRGRYAHAVDFIQQLTHPGDNIYVGAGRHDRIFASAVMLYFLADRPPATKWYELHPGVQTRTETQLHMIEELRRMQPGVVVLDTAWDRVSENNGSSQSSGVHFLDEWLGECYTEAARIESVRILAPRAGDARCTAPAP